jgi:hypothetical protein
VVVDDVEAGSEFEEDRRGQSFSKDICKLGRRGDVQHANVAERNALPDEVEVDFDMLRSLMLNWVRGQVHGADVVAVDDGGSTWSAVELVKKLSKPARFSYGVCDSSVFRFGGRARHRVLALGAPGDEVVADVHAEP